MQALNLPREIGPRLDALARRRCRTEASHALGAVLDDVKVAERRWNNLEESRFKSRSLHGLMLRHDVDRRCG